MLRDNMTWSGAKYQVRDLPLEQDDHMDPGTMVEARQMIADAVHRVDPVTVSKAYQAWLG